MSETVILRNSREGEDPPAPPTTQDGHLYPYCMYFDGAKYMAFAATPADLLAVLIPGYTDLEPQAQLEARIRLAIDAEVWNGLTAKEREILASPRFEQPEIDFWNPPVTLVLVETGYAPYTERDQPVSGIADVANPPNISWLRPMDEWELLETLAEVGFIRLHEAVDL
jgi:hypothetical protein